MTTKQLTADQSFDTQIISDKMLTVRFYFHGQHWEDFARILYKHFPPHIIGFFTGGSVNMAQKKATIRGEFSLEQFMDKCGKFMPDWKFELDHRKRWHMPTKGKDDALKYSINNYDPNDLLEDIASKA